MPFISSISNESDIAALAAALAETTIGSVVGYDTLSAAIGSDVRRRRYLLFAAMRRLNTDSGAIFGNVTRVGYMRLAATETGVVGSNARRKMRRTASNASKTMANSLNRANDLPPEVQRKVIAEIATMSMIAHLTKDHVVKAQGHNNTPPPLADSLRGVMRQLGAE